MTRRALRGGRLRRPGSARLDPGAVRAELAARLPEYMLPSSVVVLPELSLTPNGTCDRKALPPPVRPASTGRRPKRQRSVSTSPEEPGTG
ncbi:hypothetical protein MTF65_01585 [Streptomyces sp. APSN-46.1]|uniref:hypothetical protein n=1 Tax=Streptomyces sp. APSN-46.1 TaxID=2929049 RepID=UPI001FB2B139|nr:hypothetical protein [Streptomyces sp. APSN-46.1]MCJ1676074.1 hypothetical protein [Streptomyces sp. APSN-46.1]